MSVEENIGVVDNQVAALNARDWDRFAADLAESVVLMAPTVPGPVKGPAALVERLQKDLINPIPDYYVEKRRAVGQGDWVCAEFEFAGTNTGPLSGPGGQTIPATNKPVRGSSAVVFKIEGGKITEAHQYVDRLGIMAQLGLAPE